MKYVFSKINNILAGQLLSEAGDTPVSYLGIDSRSLRHPAKTIFFAIKTVTGNGHRYIRDCYDKGVRCFVVEEVIAAPGPDCNIILVPSAIAALQKLASWHRNQFHIPVIGITGSNGKTIVKEWLYQLLNIDYNIVRSPKSYNSQVGVPLSVWQMNEGNTLGIFEAGISQPGEMEKLEEVIRPTIGIFTNLGSAHQANFNSMEQKAREKWRLFKNCYTIIYRADNLQEETNLTIIASQANKQSKLISWGNAETAAIKVREISIGKATATLHIRTGENENSIDEELQLIIPFTDHASIENAMHCYVLMHYLGYRHELIQERIFGLQPVEMRLEIKAGINGCTIINDSYNSDPVSLSIALDVLNQQTRHTEKVLILSDIFESGKNEKELYEEISLIITQKGLSRFIGIGKAISRQKNTFPANSEFYDTTEEFLSSVNENSFNEVALLIKGSRAFGFERIARRLQQKAHITVLEINLNAIIHNLNLYRSFLKPEVKIMAMVKASSYGGGAHEIASTLQHHKVDYLAVAYADEGVYLRQNGITLPVMVMNPDESAFDAIIAYRLEPEIYSLRLLDQFLKFTANRDEKQYPVHIKIDTGMHRLGFEEQDIAQLLDIIKKNPALQIRSVFTHLASTDVANHDNFTLMQLKAFEDISDRIRQVLPYPVLRHALNSAGAARFPGGQFDMVRLGIGLFGIDPSEEISAQLEPVNTLKTHISQVKQIKKGDTVGYSRKGVLPYDATIATIGIGYADGFIRMSGNGTVKVFVNGKEAPTLGNICMDMCMLDITGIEAKEGDEVIIFNKEYPIELLASRLGTIPYEVLTNISQRVKRVYYKE